jgi:preprotein translocase subunit SecB
MSQDLSSVTDAYPIQLVYVGVRELHIETFFPPHLQTDITNAEPSLPYAISAYDPEEQRIEISLGCDIEKVDDSSQFELRVRIVGLCQLFDSAAFPKDEVEKWALHNGPLLLYPYLREQVFNLTHRCGYTPLMLPLLKVPNFKIERKE